MSFRKRGFQELVDNTLTELTGGIVDEPIVFRTPTTGAPTFGLDSIPVARISSVTGTVGGDYHQFADTDFELTPDRTAIRWLRGARPDEESTFLVDYYPDSATSPITDRNVGSVARTLVEALGREIAMLYEQMDLVYRSGFIDTAEGSALDFVVSLLSVKRIRAGREVGEVVFGRGTPAPGDITIPPGTVVATPPQGDKQVVQEFETTASRTLRQGQTEVGAPIRFLPTPDQEAAFVSGQVPPGTITLLPKPIVGVESVTNPEATTRGAQDETDDQLRQRATKALAEAGKSTTDALRAAVLSHGPGVNVVVQDMPSGIPGEVGLVIDGADDAQRRAAIFSSVLATKAAGVIVRGSFSEPVTLALTLSLQTRDDVQLSSDDRRRLESAVAQAIAGYVGGLKAGEDVSRNALVALSLADPRIRSVSLDTLSTRRAGLPDDTVTRLRDATGRLTNLAGVDHVSIGQLEKAETAESNVTVSIAVGAAEVTTAVRFDVTLVSNPTSIGIDRGVTETSLQPQVETLVRSFVESPDRGSQVRLADLLAFVEQGSGLFTLKPFPESFLVAEHLATGLVEREVDTVSLGEKERAELKSLTLRLLV